MRSNWAAGRRVHDALSQPELGHSCGIQSIGCRTAPNVSHSQTNAVVLRPPEFDDGFYFYGKLPERALVHANLNCKKKWNTDWLRGFIFSLASLWTL